MRFPANNLLLYHLHAVHDIDAGRELVPLLGLLHARHAIDTLCVGRNVGCDVADAVGDWLNYHLVSDHLAVQYHSIILCIELSTVGLYDRAVVKHEVGDVADRTRRTRSTCLPKDSL